MASQGGSMQDRNSLEKYIRQLAMKAAQIIVQSRLGEKIATESNPNSTSSDWGASTAIPPGASKEFDSSLGYTPQIGAQIPFGLSPSSMDMTILLRGKLRPGQVEIQEQKMAYCNLAS
uniref:Uncharacterized protein n=1 Tax=Anopheles culicifacies TaxID=139723 RepID=A0A182MLQ5_9DIPT